MLNWALESAAGPDPVSGPIAIRYPKGRCPGEIPEFSQELEKGQGVWIRGGPENASGVCLAFTGGLYREVRDAAERLTARGIEADLYNLRFLKPIDEDYLADIMNRYELIVFIEEGIRAGGFGEYAAELALRRGCTGKVLVLAVPEHFVSLGTRAELIRMNGLDGEGIAAKIMRRLAETCGPGYSV
jgi:1-deoxy-D-xylulose-5-phosphate synthase